MTASIVMFFLHTYINDFIISTFSQWCLSTSSSRRRSCSYSRSLYYSNHFNMTSCGFVCTLLFWPWASVFWCCEVANNLPNAFLRNRCRSRDVLDFIEVHTSITESWHNTRIFVFCFPWHCCKLDQCPPPFVLIVMSLAATFFCFFELSESFLQFMLKDS